MDIGQFDLLDQRSGGRYGAIWKAADPLSGREVALKQLALAAPEQYGQIFAEVERARSLRHDNVVDTAEPAINASGIWLVEEWVTGASLAQLLPPAAQLSLRQRLGVLHGALQGLAYVHHHGSLHGSFSPRTILINTDGTPKLAEFGAWLGHPDAAGIGAYASPEAFVGEPLTPAADVYSAGAVIAQLLVDPDPDDAYATQDLLADLQPVIDRAMAADPGQRQADGQQLLDDLEWAAERSMGAAWWTTEGLGAIAASTAAASLATSATATAGGAGALSGAGAVDSGGAGAVSGSINLNGGGAVGGGAAPSAGRGVLGGARTVSGKLIAIVAGSVVVVVASVSGWAVSRGNDLVVDPGANAPGASASGQAPGGQDPGGQGPGDQPSGSPGPSSQDPSPSPTPKPTTTPKPKPQQGFTGTYRYVSVVTKSVGGGEPVGKKYTTSWAVKTTCADSGCTSSVKPGDGESFDLDSLNTSFKITSACVQEGTSKKTGEEVPMAYKRQLAVATRKGDMVTKVSGSDSYRQLKKCTKPTKQTAPMYEVRKKITITFVKS